MDSHRRLVPSGGVSHAAPYARVIIAPSRPSHFSPYSGAGHSRQTVTMAARSVQPPANHYTVRRPVHNDAYKSVNPAPKSYNNFRPMHQHPRSNMVFVDSVSRLPQTQQTNSSNVIDVSLLALLAEKALDSFGIMMDKQIWFEAIMMTFGENMSVVDASDKIGVNRKLLFRLMNTVRIGMGFSPMGTSVLKQFPSEDAVTHMDMTPPVQRVIRVVRALPSLQPPMPPEWHDYVMSPTKSAEESFPEFPQTSDEPWNENLPMPVSASTGEELIRESLHFVKSSIVNRSEQLATIPLDRSEQSRALDYASIASMRTVLIEVTRTDFKGNYEDLEAYFKNLLLRHKQDASPSVIRAMAIFVANKNANFNKITNKEKNKRQLMRTMLRMALFEKRLECTDIELPDPMENENIDAEQNVDEYCTTSQEWLSNTVEELAVPITVTDVNIILDLIEKKKDRACLKALYRFVSPLGEADAMMRVVIERQIMDGYDDSSNVSIDIFEFWSRRMETMLECLLKEYPHFFDKWKNCMKTLAANRIATNAAKEMTKRRESMRIKSRVSQVPDSLYLDKIFNRDLKRSFIAFLKQLQYSGFPLSMSTVVSIGEKIVKMLEEQRRIMRDAWIGWIDATLGDEDAIYLFEYIDRDK